MRPRVPLSLSVRLKPKEKYINDKGVSSLAGDKICMQMLLIWVEFETTLNLILAFFRSTARI